MTTSDTMLHGPRTAAGSAHWRPRAGDVVFGAVLLALLVLAAWDGRGTWIFIDEWKILTRYHDGHWLEPFNGHLSLVPVALYRGLLETVGYHYAWYRLVGLLCYAAVPTAVYVFARGRVSSIVAALAAILVGWSSQAALMIMFPLLLNFSVPMAAVVTIWILLDRDDPRADVVASILMAVALASSAVGVLAPITVGTDLIVRRERRWRRWLTFAPPVALWVAWYLAYDVGETGAGGSIAEIARFAGNEFLATFSGFVGEWTPGGVVLLVATGALVLTAAVRWHTFDRRGVTILVTLAGFVLLTATGRNSAGSKFHVAPIAPDSDRYLWVNGLLVICLVVHCLRGRRIPAVAIAAVAALAVANGVVLADRMNDYGVTGRGNVANLRTTFLAVDALGSRADPSRALPLGFIPVSTRDYLALVRHFGSPVEEVRGGRLGDPLPRTDADRWLIADLGIRLQQSDAGISDDRCTVVADATSDAGVAVRPPATLVVEAGAGPATVQLRRFAATYDAPPLGTVAPGARATLVLPADRSARRWHLRVDGPDGVVRRCPQP